MYHNGGKDPPPLGLWSDGRLELQSSLEGQSGNCQMTNTIQNLFNGMYIIFSIKEGCWLRSGPQ